MQTNESSVSYTCFQINNTTNTVKQGYLRVNDEDKSARAAKCSLSINVTKLELSRNIPDFELNEIRHICNSTRKLLHLRLAI